jgi:uncharacterized membrane protein YeaQ/YmgE (transglycosylase-associated protein family)
MFNIIGWLISGLIIGLVARFLISGTQPMGWIMTILLGLAGTAVGGLLSSLIFGQPQEGVIHWPGWIMSILGAVIVLAGYIAWTRRKAP